MSFVDNIKNSFKKPQKSFNPDLETSRKVFEYLERLQGVKVEKFGDYESYYNASLGKIWASYRACDMVASVVSSTMYRLVDKNGKEKRDVGIEKILTHPNTHETFKELLYVTTMQLKMTGNAYWYKDQKNLGGDLNLIPLYSQYVKPVPDPKRKIKEYEYTRNGHTTYYPPEKIIHFKKPNPKDPIVGIGDIEASEQLFQDYINQGQIRAKGLERGNIPAGILVREEYEGDEAEWERAKASWEQKYISKGRGQGGIAWLTGKWNFLKIGLTPQETEQTEFEEKTEREIFLAHGVPASIAGFEEAANYATARQDYINFIRFTCYPIAQFIFARLNDPDEFIQKRNPNVLIEYTMDGLLNVEQVVADYKPLVEMGAMTLNELRLKCGLKSTDNPDHDNYYAPNNIVPLEDVTAVVQEPITEIPTPPPATPEPEPIEEEIEEEDEIEEEGTRIYVEKVSSVPSYISKNASRGLELRGKYGGGGLTPKTIREARLMARGEISDNKAVRMSAWFLRHESDLASPRANEYLRGETDRPTAGQVAWLLWGGDLGAGNRMRAQKWAERQANRIRNESSSREVDVKSIKKIWKHGEFGYTNEATRNAKRALAWLDTHKANYEDSVYFEGRFSAHELRGIAKVLAEKKNISYRSLCKIASALYENQDSIHKIEHDSYKKIDSVIVDLLGGLAFIRWASDEVGD